MKKKLFFLLLFIQFKTTFLYASLEPTLLVVRGTANSGKSTLCRTLADLFNKSYNIVSQDDVHRKVNYKAYTTLFPAEMASIHKAITYENRWQAIKYGNILFSEQTNEEEKQSAINAIITIRDFFNDPNNNKRLQSVNALGKQKVMQQLIFHAAQGRNVIFDAWGVTNWDYELNELKKFFGNIVGIVTYCSLKTVKQRWKNRNVCAMQTNNLTETRSLTQMLQSFFGFLQRQSIETINGDCIIITKMDFDKLIQKTTQYVANNQENKPMAFPIREFTSEQLLDFKRKMYTKFNFNESEEVAVVPSIAYDVLLSTEGDCHDYAAQLLQKITLFLYEKQK